MVCTKCGKEMRKGYLFASKDGAFSFANEVPGVFEKADKADGFIEITSLKPGHRISIILRRWITKYSLIAGKAFMRLRKDYIS